MDLMFIKNVKIAYFYPVGKNGFFADVQTLIISGFTESFSKPVKSSIHK